MSTRNLEVKMQEYIINEKTLNRIVQLLEDKPFKLVIDLLNEIKASPVTEDENLEAVPIEEENINK